MKKVFSILLFAMILISCEKAKWEKDSPLTDDGNYIIFQGHKCPIVEIKNDIAYLKVNGKEIAKVIDNGEYITMASINKNEPIEWGFSCYCDCCGCRWSTRKESQPFQNCIPCPVGGTAHKIQHPYFHSGCWCGACNLFIINPE